MAARKPLPGVDHVMRFVPRSKQHWDEETNQFLGLGSGACMLRDDDKGGLSVTWIEHFGAKGAPAKRDAAVAFRSSLPSKKLPAQGLFASAEVNNIIHAGKVHQKKLRVVHDPIPDNTGHSEVRHFTDDDFELLDLLASEIFIEIDFVGDLDLPKS
jgi:hypothetical protein